MGGTALCRGVGDGEVVKVGSGESGGEMCLWMGIQLRYLSMVDVESRRCCGEIRSLDHVLETFYERQASCESSFEHPYFPHRGRNGFCIYEFALRMSPMHTEPFYTAARFAHDRDSSFTDIAIPLH